MVIVVNTWMECGLLIMVTVPILGHLKKKSREQHMARRNYEGYLEKNPFRPRSKPKYVAGFEHRFIVHVHRYMLIRHEQERKSLTRDMPRTESALNKCDHKGAIPAPCILSYPILSYKLPCTIPCTIPAAPQRWSRRCGWWKGGELPQWWCAPS